jgi:preprotein translocase subunit SecD
MLLLVQLKLLVIVSISTEFQNHNIQKQGARRIVVELPGIAKEEEAKRSASRKRIASNLNLQEKPEFVHSDYE